MSIEVTYRRMSQQELTQMLANPADAVLGFLPMPEFKEETEESPLPDKMRESKEHRMFRLGKDWHALHFLLTGEADLEKPAKPPLGKLVLGGTPTPINATYGKVRFLNPSEVREIAQVLREISVERLANRFDADQFNSNRIYPDPEPDGWDEDEIESLLELYPRLVAFFHDAADAGEIMVISSD